jgi:tRNA pseudouridine38-40 synthase
MVLKRYKLTIEYEGTDFAGWQKQKNRLGIQQLIEEAIFKLSGEKSMVYGAGRTDAGVHAFNQVAHFELMKDYPLKQVSGAINHYLKPHPIVIKSVEEVNNEFHARFSAKFRSYVYQIVNRATPLALYKDYAWHIGEPLDIESMSDAAQILVGEHDFSSFRSAFCQSKRVVKSIDEILVGKAGPDLIKIYIKAPSFLHNQVRIIVGCLVEIGKGKWDKKRLQKVLEAKDRKEAAKTAPPQGLFLYEIEY